MSTVTMNTWAKIFNSLDDIAKEGAEAASVFLTDQKVETPRKGEGVDKTDFSG